MTAYKASLALKTPGESNSVTVLKDTRPQSPRLTFTTVINDKGTVLFRAFEVATQQDLIEAELKKMGGK